MRSANRSARIAEQAMLAGLRPLLVPSRFVDPDMKVLWSDRHVVRLPGGRAVFEEQDGVIYLAMGLRNAGAGIMPHSADDGWYCQAARHWHLDRPAPR